MSQALSHPRATCRSRHSCAPCNGAHHRRRSTIGMSQRDAVRDRPFGLLHGVVGNRRFACASTAADARRDRRTRELDQRKMYLKNCWYAIANACDVKRKIHPTTALDMDLVVYRDHEGLVHCLDGVSPISGEDLSKGALSVVGGRTLIRGRDQDYMFTEDGSILYNGQTVEGQAVDVWDVVEAGGFIWMYFGDAAIPREDRSPIPSIPELADPGWKSVHGEVRIKANHWMVFENVIDMAHVPYVHTATVGQHAQMVDIEVQHQLVHIGDRNAITGIEAHVLTVSCLSAKGVESGNVHVQLELSEHSIVASFPIRSNDGGVSIEAKATAFLPSTSFIRFNFPLGIDLITINSCVPINEHETVIRFCSLRNCFRTPLLDPLVSRGVKNILGEDKDILEKLLPERINQEISMASDSPQIAFRKMRRQYIDAGLAVAPGWRAPASQQQALRRGGAVLSTSAHAQHS